MANYEIDIREVNEITNGVEVFASATKDGQPVGFGQDGSVEIERFRIINPPILVPDPLGDIEHVSEASYADDGTPLTERLVNTYREDPEEALKQVIGHNVSLVGKDGSNIIAGKIGNTTTTVYSEDPNTDGCISHIVGPWATNQTASAGGRLDETGVNLADRFGVGVFNVSGTNWIERGVVGFEVSDIGTDTVDSATLSMVGNFTNVDVTGDEDPTVYVTYATPASNTALALGDWDQIGNIAAPATGSYGSIGMASVTTAGAYNDITLNATGEGDIETAGAGDGDFMVGLRSGDDRTAEPTGWSANNDNRTIFVAGDTAGTTSDPKLVVTHTAAAPVNEVKSINGLSNV